MLHNEQNVFENEIFFRTSAEEEKQNRAHHTEQMFWQGCHKTPRTANGRLDVTRGHNAENVRHAQYTI